jgi:hypothetical protein
VHGVRAASQICSTVEEEHETLTTLADKVSAGVRGSVLAGLDVKAGVALMALHMYDIIDRWVGTFDPAAMAIWCLASRAWCGLGMPNAAQLQTTASGNAHVEAIATFQAWARASVPARKFYLNAMRTPLKTRTKAAILKAPFSIRFQKGYLSEGRLARYVSDKMRDLSEQGKLGVLPMQFFSYGDYKAFVEFANAIVTGEPGDMIQAKVLADAAAAHPYSIYLSFCSRIERAATVREIVGSATLQKLKVDHLREARESKKYLVMRIERICE